MTSIQVADQAFIAAEASAVASRVRRTEEQGRWWPDLTLTVSEDRGDAGVRWTVSGPVRGTMEVWLEPVLDGVIVHYFLHGEPASPPPGARGLAAANHRRRVDGKAMAFDVKAALEAGRPAGEPPSGFAGPDPAWG